MTFFCLGNDVDEVYQSSAFCLLPPPSCFLPRLSCRIYQVHAVFVGLTTMLRLFIFSFLVVSTSRVLSGDLLDSFLCWMRPHQSHVLFYIHMGFPRL